MIENIKRFVRRYFFCFGITSFLFTLLSLIPAVNVEILVTTLYSYAIWLFLVLLINTLLFTSGLDLKELWIRRAVSIAFSTLTFVLIYYKSFLGDQVFSFILLVAVHVVTVVVAWLIEDSYIRRKLKKINNALKKSAKE